MAEQAATYIERLQARFPNAILTIAEARGEVTLEVPSQDWRAACLSLRDDFGFEQLVDPGRTIPPEGIPIHGIRQDMVDGQPRIGAVLPVFHAFAQDTVLVAHNAAFDMKFLQMQEEATGVVFRQPVLDTLLLSAVVHPNQESHAIEAIAERLNIAVTGRHTALGDALVTAEIWLRLVPMLAEQGVLTLGQAREAAQKTYYARLKY